MRSRTAAIVHSFQIRGMSKENEGGVDGSLGSPPGGRAARDAGSPDRECDCPGPPPRFYLPPPPRPHFLPESDCSENSTARLDACEAVPVIDAEHRYGPAVPSVAIIMSVAVAVAVAVFLLIGTFLVLIKRRKMRNLFPRKSSPQNRCDASTANGVIYEDLTNIRPRMLPPGQTTLPSIEMMDVGTHPGPAATCPAPPAQDSFDPRELFNPVYEELSNGSGEGGETDSEGMPRAAASEDEFAEDELSFGGEAEFRRGRGGENPGRGSAPGSDFGDVESADSDDECKFLENSGRDSDLPPEHRDKGKKTRRGSYFRGVPKKPKASEGKKVWRTKELPPLQAPPVDRHEFREGFLLERMLQIYPDVTGMGPRCGCGPPNAGLSEAPAVDRGSRYESLDAFAGGHLRRPKPEIFSTFGQMQGFAKNQNQDSDSGYSNNTSGGKSSSRTRKEYRLTNRGESAVLS